MRQIEIKAFEHEGFGTLRCMLDEGDEPRFVAADGAKGRGYRDASRMTRVLDGEVKGVHSMGPLCGGYELTMISENGAYHMVLRSHDSPAIPGLLSA